MSDWKVHRSKCACTTCEQEIEQGKVFWSRLVENTVEGEEALKRQDFCEAHWPAEGKSFCFWQTTRSIEENKGPRMLDQDTLLTIFQELPESEEPRKVNFRYLLALILMRKKILKEYKKDATVLKLTDTVQEWEVGIPDMDADARRLAEEDIGQLIVGLPEPKVSSEGNSEQEVSEPAA